MQNNLIIISVEPPELCVAEIRDGRLFDLHVERGGRVLNNIFKGRVEDVVPGMDAAFLNIGLSRNALMYAGDVKPDNSGAAKLSITELLKPGDELVVQIARPPVGSKGARVTSSLSLAGRFVLLTAHADSVGVSRRIESDDERTRLRRLAEKYRPLDHSLVMRTEAEGVNESLISQDIETLFAQMQSIRERAKSASAPALLHREAGLLGRIARDRFTQQVQSVLIDSKHEYDSFVALTQDVSPQLMERIQLYEEPIPLLHKFWIEEEIARVQEKTVQLPHGGFLVIDEAEALIAIDVNTGKFTGKTRLADTVLQTNLEAVEESSRQMRLRDLGGVIVIDFIDMERHRDRIKVLDALEAALKNDRTKTKIVQLSPSGLVEITRRREGQSIRNLVNRSCPYCTGNGVIKTPTTIAVETRRRIRQMAVSNTPEAHAKDRSLLVVLHPEAATAFVGNDGEYVIELEKAIGAEIVLQVEPNFHLEASRLEWQADSLYRPTGSVGALLNVPAQAGLYPHREPQFLEWQERLVRVQNPKELRILIEQQKSEFTLEITENGRWFDTARVVAGS